MSSISIKSIRDANAKLMKNGIRNEGINEYSGDLKISIDLGTMSLERTFSKEALNAAFKKSILDYAKKL